MQNEALIERRKMMFQEMSDLDDEIGNKIKHTYFKARLYKLASIMTSFVTICGGIAVSFITLINSELKIPIVIIGTGLALIKSIYELFRWGPRGIFFMQASIKLKRLNRELNNRMFNIHKYSLEQLWDSLNTLRNDLDDIDLDNYRIDVEGAENEKAQFVRNDTQNNQPGQSGNQNTQIIQDDDHSVHHENQNNHPVHPEILDEIQDEIQSEVHNNNQGIKNNRAMNNNQEVNDNQLINEEQEPEDQDLTEIIIDNQK